MSDLNEWLEERRRIHDAATGGVWVHDEYTGVGGVVYPDTAFAEAVADCGDRDDSAAIVDAHNNLPAALTMIENVLELHTETVHGECAICFECTYDDGYEVDYSPFDYPCPTVQSVRSAIERSE